MARRIASGRQAGWALFTAMVAVALVSAATLVPLRHERTAQQRERERELLWIGAQYRRAIASYHAASPGSVPQFPATLEDLLEDKRFPNPRRHLRRLYADPMTGRPDWTLIREQGAIVGVASRSAAEPFKRAGFAAEDNTFAGQPRYADWRFVHPATAAPAAAAAVPPPPPAPPAEPTAPAGPERRAECLRALTRQINQCLLETDAAACRQRAWRDMQACLRGG
jgi:hypothetical protein